jgi:hypothetical protein
MNSSLHTTHNERSGLAAFKQRALNDGLGCAFLGISSPFSRLGHVRSKGTAVLSHALVDDLTGFNNRREFLSIAEHHANLATKPEKCFWSDS